MSTFSITPPSSLTLDGSSVSEGTFSITEATSFSLDDAGEIVIEEIELDDSATFEATIGSNVSNELFDFPDETLFLQVEGFFDPGELGGSVANFNITAGEFEAGAENELTILLPVSTGDTVFQVTEFIPDGSNDFFTSAEPELVLLPEGDSAEDLDENAMIIGGRVVIPETPLIAIDPLFPPLSCGCQSHGMAVGDPHLTTFDGLEYDFLAVGEYTFVETVDENLEVQIITERDLSVEGSDGSYITGVATNVGDDTIRFDLNNSPEDILYVNGQATSLEEGNVVVLEDGLISFNNNESPSYTINYFNGEQLIVEYNDLETQYFDVDFAPSESDIVGLLGNNNGDISDDLALRDGTILSQPASYDQINSELASSWSVSAEDSLFI